MANYSLVINSQFQPFSYAEMLAPVQQATQAHQQLEDQYSALALQAAEAASEASATQDPIAYARYQKYSEDLSKAASMLAARGLQRGDRQALMDLRTRYGEDIIPIQKAIAHRQEEAKIQQQALLQNPELMFSRRAAGTSLDDYLMHPDIYQNIQMASGKHIREAASEMAKKIATEVSQYGYDTPLDSFTNVIKTKYGLSSKDIQEFIDNPDSPNANKTLSAIVRTVMDGSGMKSWANDNTLKRGYDYAYQGLWDAVGPEARKESDNWQARQDYAFNQEMQKMAAEYAYRAALNGGNGGHGSGSGGYGPGGAFDKNGKLVRELSPEEYDALSPEEKAIYNDVLAANNGNNVQPYDLPSLSTTESKWKSLPNAGKRFITKEGKFNSSTYEASQDIVQGARADFMKKKGRAPKSYSELRTWLSSVLKEDKSGKNITMRHLKYDYPNLFKALGAAARSSAPKDGGGHGTFGNNTLYESLASGDSFFRDALMKGYGTDLYDAKLGGLRVNTSNIISILNDVKAFDDDVVNNRFVYETRNPKNKENYNSSYYKLASGYSKNKFITDSGYTYSAGEGLSSGRRSNFSSMPNSTVNMYVYNKEGFSKGMNETILKDRHYVYPVSTENRDEATSALALRKGSVALKEPVYEERSFKKGKDVDVTLGGTNGYAVTGYIFGKGNELIVNLESKEGEGSGVQAVYPECEETEEIKKLQTANNKLAEKAQKAYNNGDFNSYLRYNAAFLKNNDNIQRILATLGISNKTEASKH